LRRAARPGPSLLDRQREQEARGAVPPRLDQGTGGAGEIQEPGETAGFSAYEEFLQLKDIRPITPKNYRLTCNGGYGRFFGARLLWEIKAKDIEHFLKKMAARKLRGTGERTVSSRTRAKYLSEPRFFFRCARRRKYCQGDPTDGLKVLRAAKRAGMALTREEAQRLLRACREPIIHSIKDSTDRRKRGEQSWNPPEYLWRQYHDR
jgi:hypothetical protein